MDRDAARHRVGAARDVAALRLSRFLRDWLRDERQAKRPHKDFFGGYCYLSQGPLPQLSANTQMSAHGLWGPRLIREMENYNHVVGLKIVGEMLPHECNRVTLDDELDQHGLRIPRVTYS